MPCGQENVIDATSCSYSVPSYFTLARLGTGWSSIIHPGYLQGRRVMRVAKPPLSTLNLVQATLPDLKQVVERLLAQ